MTGASVAGRTCICMAPDLPQMPGTVSGRKPWEGLVSREGNPQLVVHTAQGLAFRVHGDDLAAVGSKSALELSKDGSRTSMS